MGLNYKRLEGESLNEKCVWVVKLEGGKVQPEGKEHSSTRPSAIISRPQWWWREGKLWSESITFLTDAFF